MIALVISFGVWWIYFDLVGRRPPRDGGPLITWMLSHLPPTLSTAASIWHWRSRMAAARLATAAVGGQRGAVRVSAAASVRARGASIRGASSTDAARRRRSTRRATSSSPQAYSVP